MADVCTFEDSKIVEDLYLERLRRGQPVARPALTRFRISPGSGAVTHEQLTDIGMELPRINYGRNNERPYRYAWGIGQESGWFDSILAADVSTGETRTWSEPDRWPGEPVFVAEPGADAENAGVLLSIVLDGERGNSFLLVLDARDLSELARVEVPHHIPFGFHGQFARA